MRVQKYIAMLKMPILGSSFCAAALLAVQPSVAAELSDATVISSFASPERSMKFASSDEAVKAFKAALAGDEIDKVAAMLGLDPDKMKTNQEVMETYTQMREGAGRKLTVRDAGSATIIDIGEKLWPMPFPLVKASDGSWSFDTYAGFEEIINRRVGENELSTIETMRAYVDAQKEYASEDRDGDGVLEYARKIISSEGETDGLYWPADLGSGISPAGEAMAEDSAPDRPKSGDGYFGYHYQILERQGANIAGGKFDYVINGNMIAGFALVAWPVRYGETGVHTFEVNANGIVYEADLGENTENLAASIAQFNPGDTWAVTDE